MVSGLRSAVAFLVSFVAMGQRPNENVGRDNETVFLLAVTTQKGEDALECDEDYRGDGVSF